jgi:hypothetical protein
MLQELAEYHYATQRQRLQEHITSALSDISLSDSSDSISLRSDLGSPISIDTPDINISSDASMDSDNPPSPTSSETDSMDSVSDFELEYYFNWS